MDFILTRFLKPLSKKIPLSEKLNIYFDNPRTEEEIKRLTKYIQDSNDPNKYQHSGYNCFIAPTEEIAKKSGHLPENIPPEFTILNFKDFLEDCKKNMTDSYSKKFFNKERSNIENNPIEVIAKMFVVLRFIEGERTIEPKKIEKENWGKRLILNDAPVQLDHDYAISITYLLSLLSFNDEYAPGSFMLHDYEFSQHFHSFDRKLNQSLYFSITYYWLGKRDEKNDAHYIEFDFAIQKLKPWIDKFDQHLSKYNTEEELDKLLFISETLRHARDGKAKSVLLAIVSILELLLTHNPDFNRFNVEDSIRKQFISKISYILYLNDRSADLEAIKSRLSVIYQQRSNIAHGNFLDLRKYLKSAPEEEYFEFRDGCLYDLINETVGFLRTVLRTYFDDKVFIEHLKKN